MNVKMLFCCMDRDLHVHAEPQARHGVGLVTGKCLQYSQEQRDTVLISLYGPAQSSTVRLPFYPAETVPGRPNTGRLPRGRVLIIINLLWLVMS